MEIVQNKSEKGTTVVLDGKSFINCVFEQCTIVYHGGETGWVNTRISDCNIQLLGAAACTANALRGLGWEPPKAWERAAAPDPTAPVN